MKTTIVLFLNLAIFISCTTQSKKDQKVILGEFGAIEGTITGLQNEPLESVNISIYDNLNLIQSTLTDSKGYFILDSLKPNTYTMEVHKNNYAFHIENNVKISKGNINNLGNFQLGEAIRDVELKPIIYLYPEKKTVISVQLDYDGELLHSYPKYQDGWKITAFPDGTLMDINDKEYYALFWEGKPNKNITPSEGFVIAGNQTVAFLEESLATLGLNRREANEFIMFWMPQMENNKYNFIYFSSTEYTERAKLTITPTPETVIRVMMHTKPLNDRITIPLQDLTPLKKERKGFTVVEWGGAVLNNNIDL